MQNNLKFFILIAILFIVGCGFFFYKKDKNEQSSLPIISQIENINIESPYAFATTTFAKSAAAFFTIQNSTNEARQLVSAISDMAEIHEIHENIIDPDDGTMMMRKIKSLPIPSQGTVSLKPKGYHIMFLRLKNSFNEGEHFPLTLIFDNGDEITTEVSIVSPGQIPENQHESHKH